MKQPLQVAVPLGLVMTTSAAPAGLGGAITSMVSSSMMSKEATSFAPNFTRVCFLASVAPSAKPW
ncbi:MAG: hypothetical protein QM765_45925 [Myxococcales bacterium]